MTKTGAHRALFLQAATAAVIAGAGALLLSPAAMAQGGSASATIDALESSGFDVRVTRVGNAPLSECVVTDVGNPREQKRLTLVQGRDHDDSALVPVVFKREISVALNCSV